MYVLPLVTPTLQHTRKQTPPADLLSHSALPRRRCLEDLLNSVDAEPLFFDGSALYKPSRPPQTGHHLNHLIGNVIGNVKEHWRAASRLGSRYLDIDGRTDGGHSRVSQLDTCTSALGPSHSRNERTLKKTRRPNEASMANVPAP